MHICSDCGFRDQPFELSDDNYDSFQQITGRYSRKLVRKRRRRRLRRIRRQRRRKLRRVRRYFRKKRRRRRRYRRRRRRTLRRRRGRGRRRRPSRRPRSKAVAFGLNKLAFHCYLRNQFDLGIGYVIEIVRVCQHCRVRAGKVGAYPVSKFLLNLPCAWNVWDRFEFQINFYL